MTPASKKSYFDGQSQAASKKKKVASKKAASKKNVKNKGAKRRTEGARPGIEEHDEELRNTTRNKKRLGTNSRTRNKEHDRGKGARQGTSSPA